MWPRGREVRMVMELLHKLATNLGLAVDHLWPVLIYQAQVHGWVLFFTGVILAVPTVVLGACRTGKAKRSTQVRTLFLFI